MGANTSSSSLERPSCVRPSQRPSSFARYSAALLSGADVVVVPTAVERKKKHRFATLRRKLARVRRQSRCADHGRAARELMSSWSTGEVRSLVRDYEATEVLRELSLHAAVARPHAPTASEDLGELSRRADCADVHLVFAGVRFPAHRALLSVRCTFFRHLLARAPAGADVVVTLPAAAGAGVTPAVFAALLRYLYTGEMDSDVDAALAGRLADVFGTPRSLAADLRTLLETGANADAALLFDGDSATGDDALTCHKAILAARSPFFRSLLLRRAGEPTRGLTPIVLDASVIPRRYARVLLHAAYLDTVDLACVTRDRQLAAGGGSVSSLGEAQAIVAGRTPHTTGTDAAMELYQIGQFLDFPVLSQGCEDVIADSIVADTLVPVLQWSCEAHGSAWVQRQALQFLRDDFLSIAHSPVLHQLSKAYMVEAIQSDFLQAGELEVLSAVIRWGEQQLMKRIEDREPNLLSQTAHSVARKGVRRRDLNDVELRAVLAGLLPHVRADHVVPRGADALTSAVKRGLICAPPSHMVADAAGYTTASAWVRAGSGGGDGRGGGGGGGGDIYVRPRLFWPYYEEAKVMLAEQLSEMEESQLTERPPQRHSAIPDTLYMVDEGEYRRPASQHNSSFSTVDIIAGTIAVPDEVTLAAMRRRETALRVTPLVQRAFSMARCDHAAAEQQLRLRVVREFALPDATAALLQRRLVDGEAVRGAKPRAGAGGGAQQRRRYIPHEKRGARTPGTPPPGAHGNAAEKDPNLCSNSALSDLMPDIAMATSSISQMGVAECDVAPIDLELDLGDRNTHYCSSGTLYL